MRAWCAVYCLAVSIGMQRLSLVHRLAWELGLMARGVTLMCARIWPPDALSSWRCILARVQSVLPSCNACCADSPVDWRCTRSARTAASTLRYALPPICNILPVRYGVVASVQLSDNFCVCTSVAGSFYGMWACNEAGRIQMSHAASEVGRGKHRSVQNDAKLGVSEDHHLGRGVVDLMPVCVMHLHGCSHSEVAHLASERESCPAGVGARAAVEQLLALESRDPHMYIYMSICGDLNGTQASL